MSLPRVYVETTIPGYLTARPSRDIALEGQQEFFLVPKLKFVAALASSRC